MLAKKKRYINMFHTLPKSLTFIKTCPSNFGYA